MGVFNAMFLLAALSAMVEAQSKMTCADVKAKYKANECCGNPRKELDWVRGGEVDESGGCWKPAEPPLQAVMPSLTGRPHYIMAVDVDSPPYAYLKQPPYETPGDLDEPVGIGPDMIKAMGKYCGFDVTVTQAHWNDCWGEGEIGQGLREGWYHGCMMYTHIVGMRNRYLEFSHSYVTQNKPAGLITRLENGIPVVKGPDDLAGKTVVDVTGWAPTADTLHFVENKCTGKKFSTDLTIVQGNDVQHTPSGAKYTYEAKGNNDKALLAMLNGVADVAWIYGDQAYNFKCPDGSDADTQAGWNCALWKLWGTDFAYIQGGMLGFMYNGTTMSISKKGSGVAKFMNDCLERFLPTREFYEVCKMKHVGVDQIQQCIPNDFIKAHPGYQGYDIKKTPYMFPTKDMAGAGESCATGYCTCEE
mmetsp:Transcript_113795/g.200827  ORF Transcript_113795/g.200827 Transcript_113795/m.200827 type:complete len:417 (-) Transcript_113795:22-1272(-)